MDLIGHHSLNSEESQEMRSSTFDLGPSATSLISNGRHHQRNDVFIQPSKDVSIRNGAERIRVQIAECYRIWVAILQPHIPGVDGPPMRNDRLNSNSCNHAQD